MFKCVRVEMSKCQCSSASVEVSVCECKCRSVSVQEIFRKNPSQCFWEKRCTLRTQLTSASSSVAVIVIRTSTTRSTTSRIATGILIVVEGTYTRSHPNHAGTESTILRSFFGRKHGGNRKHLHGNGKHCWTQKTLFRERKTGKREHFYASCAAPFSCSKKGFGRFVNSVHSQKAVTSKSPHDLAKRNLVHFSSAVIHTPPRC